jgi:hypothetical protein
MKVKEVMERVGSRETGRIVAYVKDALREINMKHATHTFTENIDLTKDQRFYDLPEDCLKILNVRGKNHLNTKDEYRDLPRLVTEPLITDKD